MTEVAASSLRVCGRSVAARPGTTWSTMRSSACTRSSGSSTTARPADDHRRAVVHRVVERRSREHQSIQHRDRDADVHLGGGPEAARCDRAVEVERPALVRPVEVHAERSRKHQRRAVHDHAEMADQRGCRGRRGGPAGRYERGPDRGSRWSARSVTSGRRVSGGRQGLHGHAIIVTQNWPAVTGQFATDFPRTLDADHH